MLNTGYVRITVRSMNYIALYGFLNIIHLLSSDMWVVQPRSQPIYHNPLGTKSVIPNTNC